MCIRIVCQIAQRAREEGGIGGRRRRWYHLCGKELTDTRDVSGGIGVGKFTIGKVYEVSLKVESSKSIPPPFVSAWKISGDPIGIPVELLGIIRGSGWKFQCLKRVTLKARKDSRIFPMMDKSRLSKMITGSG